MAEPLSVVTGVLALLKVTGTVGNELKKLHDGAAIIHSTIDELHKDVDGLRRVLISMRDAFERITAEGSTGHIGALWEGVAQSIVDGKRNLEQLHDLVTEINKDSNFLDDYRKQLRLNRSEGRISRCRVHIQSCRDTLQLSLQTIVLVNQHAFQDMAEQQLVPSLIALQEDVHRIGRRLNEAIGSSQARSLPQQEEAHQATMKTLLECVRSAASVISDASTVASVHQNEGSKSPASQSDSCFPPRQSLALRRWFDSRSVYDYQVEQDRHAVRPESIADVVPFDNSEDDADSDTDLQNEMTRLLLDSGKQRLSTGNHRGAERLLLNSLERTTASEMVTTRQIGMQLEATETLYSMYLDQQRFPQAEKMLLRTMAFRERITKSPSTEFLTDVLHLAEVLKEQNKTYAAQLHARRALKGYRKLQDIEKTRSCLHLLVSLCHADGSESDLDVYEVMLENLSDGSMLPAKTAAPSKTLPPASGGQDLLAVLLAPLPQTTDEGQTLLVEDLEEVTSPSQDMPRGKLLAALRAPLPQATGEGRPLLVEEGTSSPTPEMDRRESLIGGDPESTSGASVASAISGLAAKRHDSNSSLVPPSVPLIEYVGRKEGTLDDTGSPSPLTSAMINADTGAGITGVERPKFCEIHEEQNLGVSSLDGQRLRQTHSEEVFNNEQEVKAIQPSSMAADRGSEISQSAKDLAQCWPTATSSTIETSSESRIPVASTAFPPSKDQEHNFINFSDLSIPILKTQAPQSSAPSQGIVYPATNPSEIRRKLTIVGDTLVGKTYLVIKFSKGVYLEDNVPTMSENYVADVEVDDTAVELAIWDTAGIDSYDRLRPLSYPDSHVILICFAIDKPDLLDNVVDRWKPEVLHFCEGVPYILVGTKLDLREDAQTVKELEEMNLHPVTKDEGEALRKRIGALRYFECSGWTGEGMLEVFEYAVRASLQPRKKKKRRGLFRRRSRS